MQLNVGLTPYSRYPDLPALQETVRTAEGLGFHGVSIGDHVVIPSSHVRTISPVWFDPFVLGMAIAASTQRLRIIFNTLILPYHNPLRLAKAVASLDVLSGGRVTVGVGVGWIDGEFEALGLHLSERGPRADEYIRAMKELWTSDSPSFQGRFVSFENIAFEPRPVQRPHPPIVVGGGVPRTLRRAAELGDGWHPLGRPWEKLRREVDELRGLLEARGRQAEGFIMGYTLYHDSVAGQTSRHTQAAGGEEATVLPGDPSQAVRTLASFRDLGFTQITLRFRGLTHPEVCAAMERFHRDVMPALQAEGLQGPTGDR